MKTYRTYIDGKFLAESVSCVLEIPNPNKMTAKLYMRRKGRHYFKIATGGKISVEAVGGEHYLEDIKYGEIVEVVYNEIRK